MTTTIRLDATALQHLISLDPDFKLELQRAVVSEITRKVYTNDTTATVKKMIAECFKDHQDDLTKAVQEDGDFRKELDKRLSALVQSVRTGRMGYATQKALSPDVEQLLTAKVQSLINEAVDARIGRVTQIVEDATQRVSEEVERRIGNVAGIVEHNWKVEALKVIKADVTKHILSAAGSI